MKHVTTHEEQLEYLRKIEGQIRGIQKMIQDKRYCVDIMNQIQSVIGALSRIDNEIFKKHVKNCVINAMKGGSELEKQEKINEVLEHVTKLKRIA